MSLGAFTGYGFDFDYAVGTMQLVSNPVGRVVMQNIHLPTVAGLSAPSNEAANVANQYDYAIFTKMGLSQNFRDPASFINLLAVTAGLIYSGEWVDTNRHSVEEFLDGLAKHSLTWYGWTPDGLLQVGMLALPAASAVKSFTMDDIAEGSLKPINKILPIDFSQCDVTYLHRNFTGGVFQGADPTFQVESDYLDKLTPEAPTLPIDTVAQGDTQPYQVFDTSAVTVSSAALRQQMLKTLFAKQLGVWQFETRLSASELSIGETISLEHDRQGFKLWTSADPASPENPATIDSRLMVVLGIDVDLSKLATTPFCVTVTGFRQVPQYATEILPAVDFLLMEDGFYLLKEDAGKIGLER